MVLKARELKMLTLRLLLSPSSSLDSFASVSVVIEESGGESHTYGHS